MHRAHRELFHFVIPAKAGIQPVNLSLFLDYMDSRRSLPRT